MVSLCSSCNKSFSSLKGLKIHQGRCKAFINRNNDLNQNNLKDISNSKDQGIETIDLSNPAVEFKPYLPNITITSTNTDPNDKE